MKGQKASLGQLEELVVANWKERYGIMDYEVKYDKFIGYFVATGVDTNGRGHRISIKPYGYIREAK